MKRLFRSRKVRKHLRTQMIRTDAIIAKANINQTLWLSQILVFRASLLG